MRRVIELGPDEYRIIQDTAQMSTGTSEQYWMKLVASALLQMLDKIEALEKKVETMETKIFGNENRVE